MVRTTDGTRALHKTRPREPKSAATLSVALNSRTSKAASHIKTRHHPDPPPRLLYAPIHLSILPISVPGCDVARRRSLAESVFGRAPPRGRRLSASAHLLAPDRGVVHVTRPPAYDPPPELLSFRMSPSASEPIDRLTLRCFCAFAHEVLGVLRARVCHRPSLRNLGHGPHHDRGDGPRPDDDTRPSIPLTLDHARLLSTI